MIELFRNSFPNAANRFTVTGIDISGNQDPGIVRDLALNGKFQFDVVNVKLSEGSGYRSAEANQQCQETLELGKALGYYHWINFRSSPSAEAANFSRKIDELGLPKQDPRQPIVLWLDIEDPEFSKHATSDYTGYCLEMAHILQSRYLTPVGGYSAGWWANGRLDSRISELPLWIADYDDQRTWRNYVEPTVPTAWQGTVAVAWQWTSLNSVTGSLDLDVIDPIAMARAANFHPIDLQERTLVPTPLSYKPVTTGEDEDMLMHFLQVNEGTENGSVYARWSNGDVTYVTASEYATLQATVPTILTDTANRQQFARVTK